MFVAIALGSYGQADEYLGHPVLRFSDQVYRDDIATVQVYPEDNKLSAPIIELNSGMSVQVNFDVFSDQIEDLRYHLVHCDAQWNPTDLEPNEYLTGFNEQQISDVEYSFNTRKDFIHYRFRFPNDMMKVRYSGNYLVVVYADNDVQNLVLSRRVIIYENLVAVNASAHASTVIAHRNTHQEVDLDILPGLFDIRFPNRDLHVSILQNWDWTRAITDLKPRFVKTDELDYDYMGVNEFLAGNEYRDFDTKSQDYLSMEIEKMTWNGPGDIVVYLKGDLPQNTKSYSTRGDIDGRFYIRNDRTDDPDLEADYHTTLFRLIAPESPGKSIFITGQFSDWRCLPKYEMHWDSALACYTGEATFKQGFYNYRYESVSAFDKVPTMMDYEGSYFQTENEYNLIVYNYDLAGGYDRVIAYQLLNTARP